MASETTSIVPVSRHFLDSDKMFSEVLNAIYEGISRPDIARLLDDLSSAPLWADFASFVHAAEGSSGLIRFMQLDLSVVLAAHADSAERLVRLIAGNPITMSQMTRHVPDAGSYAPVSILIRETGASTATVAYDTVASAIMPYGNDAASAVANSLDREVLQLLRLATGITMLGGAQRPDTPDD